MAQPTTAADQDIVFLAYGIDLGARWTPDAADLRRADAAIEVMGLRPLAGMRWPVLWQGERSRALIARALAGSRRCCCSTSQRPGLTRMLAAGPAADVLTSELVSTCFGYPAMIARHAGRWTCTAGPFCQR